MKKLKQFLTNLRNICIKFGSNSRRTLGLWIYPEDRKVVEVHTVPYNVTHLYTSVLNYDTSQQYVEEEAARKLVEEIIKNNAMEFKGRYEQPNGTWAENYAIHVVHPDGGYQIERNY